MLLLPLLLSIIIRRSSSFQGRIPPAATKREIGSLRANNSKNGVDEQQATQDILHQVFWSQNKCNGDGVTQKSRRIFLVSTVVATSALVIGGGEEGAHRLLL